MVSNRKTHLWMALAGLAVVIGFFLPLFEVGGRTWLSGWEILRKGDLPARQWLMLVGYPIGGLALLVTALAGTKSARWVSLGVGALIILYPTYKLISLIVEIAGVGAFMIFGGGLVALICGLASGAAKPTVKK